MVASAKPAMSVEAHKEIEDFFRNMRQAFNSRDIKAYRAHFWTDKRFVHFDASGRIDVGWGAYEEFLDQEFRYMETLKLELKDLVIQVFGDDFASTHGQWKLQQIDAGGREQAVYGRATFTLHRIGSDWKIVSQHFSAGADDPSRN
jgi:ketosteroid isomerase-like protein